MRMDQRARGVLSTALFALVLTVVGLGRVVHAQDTRAEEIAAKQKEKAAQAAPYQPTQFEKIMTRVEANFVSPPSGIYPVLGSVYSGGGFTPGLGYRRFYARRAVWDVVGLYSFKNYKSIQFGTRTPWTGRGKWMLDARTGWLDAPQVGYYGTGMDQTQPRANYRLQQGYAALTASLRPSRWTRLQGEVAYEAYDTEQGKGSAPSIETIYTPETAPGLGASPTFVRTEGTAAIDWRRAPMYARKGGLYAVSLTNFGDLDDTFSFQRLDGEVVQHLPILRETWVISLRARVQTVLDSGDTVPYFLLPQLGSGRTLRAYSTGRFRDRHSLLTSAEFRWIPSRLAMDMAVFYDAGKVANRRGDLNFEDMADDWGIGARFHGPTSTVLRIEMARGSDGWKLVFATSAPF
jgi:outer membrane protein assembly factor BamA